MKKSSYIFSVITILAMVGLWYFIFIDYIAVCNPDRTLQVKVPASGYSVNWSQLEPEGNRLRMSYAPDLDTTKEVVLSFELLDTEVSPEIDMVEHSRILPISNNTLPQETTVNGYRAIQYDNVFKDTETGEEKHLTIIFAEQEKHYLLIDILCKEEDYTSDREAAYWKVIDTVKEIVKT